VGGGSEGVGMLSSSMLTKDELVEEWSTRVWLLVSSRDVDNVGPVYSGRGSGGVYLGSDSEGIRMVLVVRQGSA
jgi:hypothetical protein